MDTDTIKYGVAMLSAAAVAYYMTRDDPKVDPLYDFDRQSIEIDEIEHVHISASIKNKPLVEYRFEDVRTLYDALPKGMQMSGNGPCLGYRHEGKGPYLWISYFDVIERTRFIGSGLLNKGVLAENTTNIALYSRNRPEWTISEYACYTYSLNVVSLYDSYGVDSIKYILNQAEIVAVFLDCKERLHNILRVAHELPSLKLIIYFDDLTQADYHEFIVPEAIEIISFKELMRLGKTNLRSPVPPRPSDSATICYTSGTTGWPKGAILTHANIISNEAAIFNRLHKPHLNVLGANSYEPLPVNLCYLPLAHMLERMNSVMLFLRGGRMGYISGDITKLLEDCKELKPNSLPMVPRLLNKLYDRVLGEIGTNKIKMFLLKTAVASKEANRKKGIVRQDTLYDKLIFKKIRALFGGNICRTATGSAPITKEVMEFSRAMFSCPIPEGFGQTEATCSITFCHCLEPQIGHCGAPVDSVMVKLVDVPEMNYFARDRKGEICAKGPSIFKGYYKDPAKTSEVIDKDGWLHTGDIGQWLPNGCLKVIDRIKHIFKLSQGEYISPEKVENIYIRSLFAAQIFVDGNSLKDFLVAIVVPDELYLVPHCEKIGIKGTFKELCRNEDVRRMIMSDLKLIGEKSGLMSYEKIRIIYLHDELFSLDNGLATPTLKLKRVNLRSYFKSKIDEMYEEMDRTRSKI